MKKNLFTKLLSRYLLCMACTIAASNSMAQSVSTYPFTSTSGTYTPVTGGTLVVSATSTAQADDSASIDDFVYATSTLPFTFNFKGTAYTEFRICSNGWIGMGNSAATTSTPISGTTATGIISGFSNDLFGVSYATGDLTSGSNTINNVSNTAFCKIGALITGTNIPSNTTITGFTANSITLSANATGTSTGTFLNMATGEIRYVIEGTAPNRVAVIQFSGLTRYSTTTTDVGFNSQINFQIRLAEAGGVASNQTAQVVYGLISHSNGSGTYQVGLRGTSSSDFNNRTNTANWTTTTAGTANSSTMTAASGNVPPSGLTYTWTPPAPCATPASQASSLTFAAAAASITGNFTAAVPAVDKYLVVRTPGVTPLNTTPVDLTTYSAGGTLGNGTIVSVGNLASFNATGLASNTQYTFTIFTVNDLCNGGPLYNTTNPLVGTFSTTAAQAYTWNATTGTVDATLPGSWTPARNVADITDTLYFSNGGSSTATNLATSSVAKVAVLNNTTIIMNSGAAATISITKDLTVDAGSTLELSGSNNLTLSFVSGGSPTATINGNLNMSGTGTSAYNAANSVTTVGTTGIVTVSNTGSISGAVATLLFNGASQYIHNRNGGTIPTATYATTSTVRVTGVTTTVAGPPASIGGNVEWNSPLQTGTALSWTSTLTSIGGSFTMNSTGTGSFQFGTSPTVTIAGASVINGGTLLGAGGTVSFNSGLTVNGTGTINGTGATTFNVTNGNFALNTGTISGSSALTFNVAGNMTQAAGGTVTGTGGHTFNITGNFNTDGTLTSSSNTANIHSYTIGGNLIQGATGVISETGTGSIRFTFNGTTSQAITFGGTMSALTNFTLNNAAGAVLTGTVANINGNTLTSGVYTGTGSFVYNSTASTLTYGSSLNQTATTLEYPTTNGPLSLTVAKGATSVLTIPGNRTVAGTLTLTSGLIDLGANTLTLGLSATAPGTSSGSGASIISGTYTRWFGTTGLPTSAGTGIGYFPMGVNGANRNISVYFSAATALSAGGTISVTHNPATGLATGLSIADGAYTIQNRTNGSWTFTAGNGITLGGTNTIGVRATGTNLIAPITVANIRLMQTNAVVGTHVAGTGTTAVPQAARTGLTIADLNASPYHIGAANADITPLFTANTSGDWSSPGTWDGGQVPTVTDVAIINSGVTVTVAASATNTAKTLTNNGTLVVSANTLAIDTAITNNGTVTVSGGTLRLGAVGGSNRLMTNSGTTTVSSGTLNVNGGILSTTGSTFNQSGGLILIDPNDGTAAGSLIAVSAFGTGTGTNNLNFSGGTIRFVDPIHSTNTNYNLSCNVSVNNNTMFTGNHTIEMGDGVSTTPGGARGFSIYSFAGSGYAAYRNITINGGNIAGRWTTHAALSYTGTFTINAGNDFRHSASLYAGGPLVNNGRFQTNSTITFGPAVAGAYVLPATSTLSGTGTWTNKIPTVSTYTTPGTGYVVGDVVTLTGGTFTTPATFYVTTVNGTGGITAATVFDPGAYTVAPSGAVNVTGGTGTGAQFTMQATATSTAYLVSSANLVGVTINNPNGWTLNNNVSFSGTVTFTNGKAITGANKLIEIPGASNSGAGQSTGWVVGTYQKGAATGNISNTYPIGDANFYTPVAVNGTAAVTTAGSIAASTTPGDHPNMAGGAAGIASTKSVNRYYTITKVDGIAFAAGTLSVTLNWNAADVDAGANTANFIGAKYDAPTWTQPTVGTKTATSIVLSGISDFSDFQVGEAYDPLAIKLVNISAANVGTRNRVDWTSAVETAGDYYELERSADGKNFVRIATIEGKGKGSDYTYFDQLPLAGVNYYRLKMVNIDAQAAYSRTVTATAKANTTFVVEAYPNPVTDKLTVNVTSTPDGKASINLIDLTGKVVRSVDVNGTSAAIDMNGMPAGIYMLQYRDASHNVTVKITKQ